MKTVLIAALKADAVRMGAHKMARQVLIGHKSGKSAQHQSVDFHRANPTAIRKIIIANIKMVLKVRDKNFRNPPVHPQQHHLDPMIV